MNLLGDIECPVQEYIGNLALYKEVGQKNELPLCYSVY